MWSAPLPSWPSSCLSLLSLGALLPGGHLHFHRARPEHLPLESVALPHLLYHHVLGVVLPLDLVDRLVRRRVEGLAHRLDTLEPLGLQRAAQALLDHLDALQEALVLGLGGGRHGEIEVVEDRDELPDEPEGRELLQLPHLPVDPLPVVLKVRLEVAEVREVLLVALPLLFERLFEVYKVLLDCLCLLLLHNA